MGPRLKVLVTTFEKQSGAGSEFSFALPSIFILPVSHSPYLSHRCGTHLTLPHHLQHRRTLPCGTVARNEECGTIAIVWVLGVCFLVFSSQKSYTYRTLHIRKVVAELVIEDLVGNEVLLKNCFSPMSDYEEDSIDAPNFSNLSSVNSLGGAYRAEATDQWSTVSGITVKIPSFFDGPISWFKYLSTVSCNNFFLSIRTRTVQSAMSKRRQEASSDESGSPAARAPIYECGDDETKVDFIGHAKRAKRATSLRKKRVTPRT